MTAVRADPEKRAQALETYKVLGLGATSRQTGIPKTTLRRWAREEGLDTAELAGGAAELTEAATAARRVYVAEMREELRALLLKKAIDSLERMDEPHIDFKGKDADEVVYPRAPAQACLQYATSTGILIDKFRLEMGESTSRTEIERGPLDQQVRRIANMRDELGDRRRSQGPDERGVAAG